MKKVVKYSYIFISDGLIYIEWRTFRRDIIITLCKYIRLDELCWKIEEEWGTRKTKINYEGYHRKMHRFFNFFNHYF